MFGNVRNGILLLVVAATVVGLAGVASAGFTAGDLVIMNVTKTGPGLTESVQLWEYNVAGATASLVSTYNIGNSVSMPQAMDNDRHMKLSANGQLLSFAAYNTAPGQTLSLTTSSASSVPRTIVTVNAAGTASTANLGAAYYDGLEISGAATVDGSQFWVAGENTKSSPATSGGPRYFNASTGACYNLYTPADDGTGTASVRSVGIYGGQLYYSSGSASFGTKCVSALGSGVTVPTADTHLTRTYLATGVTDSVTDFVMLDTNNDGVNDLGYAARKSGVQKFHLSGSTWVNDGLLAVSGYEMNQITARLFANPTNGTLEADVFAVSNVGNLYKITDTNVAIGTFSGNMPATPYIAATDNTGFTFGGLDFAPVPEPFTLSLLAAGSLALIRRRRA